MTWRFIAQRISGPSAGQFVDWDLPLRGVEVTQSLGAGWMSGAIDPMPHHRAAHDGLPVLDPWSTAVWVEEDGVIRGGGILVESTYNNTERVIHCMGYAGYPSGIPYDGDFSSESVDPINVFRHIWDRVQSARNSDLNMVFDGTTSPIRLGSKKDPNVSGSGPYTLGWWEALDCGDLIADLAELTPFEYRERHTWNAGKTDIIHRIQIGYPKLGRRRDDLRFVLGENLIEMPDFTDNGTEFANEVLVLGAGTGRAMVRHSMPSGDHRLRRVAVVTDKSAKTTEQLRRVATLERNSRALNSMLTTIEVLDHPNAGIGSWEPGDEVLIQAQTPWTNLQVWCRIRSTTIKPESDRAVLQVERV